MGVRVYKNNYINSDLEQDDETSASHAKNVKTDITGEQSQQYCKNYIIS